MRTDGRSLEGAEVPFRRAAVLPDVTSWFYEWEWDRAWRHLLQTGRTQEAERSAGEGAPESGGIRQGGGPCPDPSGACGPAGLPAFNLSGGQKQRVAIGRALVGNPDIILADEPTAALDWETAARVVDLLKQLGRARGTTTVMVTHDNRILDRADRILTLEDGRLVRDEDQRASRER